MNDDPPLSKEEAEARYQLVLDKLNELNHTIPSRSTTAVLIFGTTVCVCVFWFLGIILALHLSL